MFDLGPYARPRTLCLQPDWDANTAVIYLVNSSLGQTASWAEFEEIELGLNCRILSSATTFFA
jgi:hypothetical protein